MSSSSRHVVLSIQGIVLTGLLGAGVYHFVEGNWGIAFPFIGLSVLAGGGMYAYGISRATSESDAAADEREEEPWTVRPEWRSNTLVDENEVEWSALLGPALGTLFALPGGGTMIYLSATDPEAPLWLAFLGLFVIGVFSVYPTWVTVRKLRRQYKFSESTLELETMPGCLGKPFRARLYAPISSGASSDVEFSVSLTCKRRYETTTPDPDHRHSHHTDTRTVTKWTDEARVTGTPRLRGERVLELPISFDLPSEPPPSTPEKKRDRILWELHVTGDLPGVDYQASFEIPVFEPDAVPAARHPREESRAAGHVEDDQIRSSTVEETSTSDAPDPASLGTDQVVVEATPSEGLRVRVGAGGNFTVIGSPLLIGLIVGGIGGSMLVVGAAVPLKIIGAVALLMGAPLLYVSLRRFTYSGEVIVEDGQVTVHSGPFGVWQTHTFPCTQLEDATIETLGRTGNTSNYGFILETADSTASDASSKGREAAEQVFENIEATGAQELMETSADWEQEIKVGEALEDKPGADRVATALVEAAARQASS